MSDILHAKVTQGKRKGKPYSGESKMAFAVVLKRLVHYAKKDTIADAKNGTEQYIDEVSWIRPKSYNKDNNKDKIQPEDLLTTDEINRFIRKARCVRDIAMLWVMFEGAFRPGEILNMRVGSVEFRDNYVRIYTHGKTGDKGVPLVLSFQPLIEWLRIHPLRDNPKAYLWHSQCSKNGLRIGYKRLTDIIKRCAKDAEIPKPVWGYLLRHTQLTRLAKKLSDQTLSVYGNWSEGSKMPSRYVHLSGKDMDDVILKLHGIKTETETTDLKLKTCSRCSKSNTPDSQRCFGCGFILDEKLLAKASDNQQSAMQNITERLSKMEKMGEKMDVFLDSLVKQKPVTAAL